MDLPILLLQVALILAASRLVGQLFVRFHQPQVVGEMVAGIMLGPSLFGLVGKLALAHGWLPFDPAVATFPAASVGYLGVLSQVGVILFLFLVGLELDPKLIRNRGHAAVVISHVSIVAPFLLGAALTLFLYPRLFHEAPAMHFMSVALFMGAAMSITAFPVLARILTERNLHKTKIGAVSITCAAVDDVTAWCLLAFVVAIARNQITGGSLMPAVWTVAYSVVYVLVMFFAIRPFLARLQHVYDRQGKLSQSVFAVILLLILLSAWTTELIGIHALFGAFLMGAMMPKGAGFVHTLTNKLEDFVVVFLLPIFFAFTGLRTQIGLLNSAELWLYTLLIIAVACLGKFGGSTLAGRLVGLSWRESSTIGILMNTRGLMELVILNIGRDLGVIPPAVFAMMVIMALATTAMTTPILQAIYPRRMYDPDYAPKPTPEPLSANRIGVTQGSAFSVLIPVADPKSGGPLLRLAELITGTPDASRRIFALHLRRPTEREAYEAARGDAPSPVPPPEESLRPLLDHAERTGMGVEPITMTSRNVPDAIARVAGERDADLILMGYHRPVFGGALLGGTVHRVLTTAPADVGIFVDRGFLGARRVLVPYSGTVHDRLALDLAARIGRNTQAEVTVMHVVPPGRDPKSSGQADAEVKRVFDDPTQPTPVQFRVVPHASPADAVLESAKDFDLIVIGVSEEWGLESHLFGFRAERIAEGSPCSLLLVRERGARDGTATVQS